MAPSAHPQDPDPGNDPYGPLLGADRDRDPGYLASVRDGSVIGLQRRMALVLVVAPVLMLAITPLIVRGEESFDGAVEIFSLVLAGLAAVVAVVAPRTPGPMRPGLPPAKAAREALMQFRQALMVRYALAEGLILCGLALGVAGGSELIAVAGFALGYPILLWLVLPTGGRVEAVRRRLESGGARSHLWAALLAASPPPPGRSAYQVDDDGGRREGRRGAGGVAKG